MLEYSIADISQITGIKAFTLRAWEKRYGIIEPSRTGTNIRKYSGDDLHKLLAVSALVKNGFKISEVCDFSQDEIRQKLGTVFAPENVRAKTGQLMKQALNFDGKSFDKTLKHEIIESGIEAAVQNVILPFMQEAENKWIADADFLPQKQFAYDLIRRRLIVAADSEENENGDKILIFSPFEDFSELSLLIADYIVKKYGGCPVYCGENVSVAQAKKAFEESSCKKVMMIGSLINDVKDISQFAKTLDKEFVDAEKIILHKNSEDVVDSFPDINFLRDVDDLKQYLNEP